MEHPSSLIPAVWYNYSSYNDLLNRSRQLQQPNVVPTSHHQMVAAPPPLQPPPAHSPIPDVSLQMAELPHKPKKIRKRENYEGKERAFLCNQCTAAFHTQSKLNTHMRIHTGIKPYVCDECGKSFVQASNLKAHKKVHTGERPYPCDECGKSFRANSYLIVHKRIHSGEKPYICGFCNEGFYSSTYLANHIRVHTGEKPYVCDFCGDAFSQSLDLRIHKRVHTGDSPYQCWECKAAFISDKELTAHRKENHKDSRPFRCPVCRKKFRRPTFVIKHQEKCLGPAGTYAHKCALCQKGFRTETFCAKHQARCKGPKPKKRIGRPPKYPRADGEISERERRRREGGGGKRRRSAKPIASTDRISRSRTKALKVEDEPIKEEPETELDVKYEKREGIDINDLVKELGIEGFTKDALDEISNEVIQTIPKENITQELLKGLLEKKEQQRNVANESTTFQVKSSQNINGHQQQQQPHPHMVTIHHQPDEAPQQPIPSNQTYSHQQHLIVPDHQQEMPGHQQHSIPAHQQVLPAHQQMVTMQPTAPQQSIQLQQLQPMPGHQTIMGPAAQLAYERALPYAVDLSGNPSNSYYSRS